MNITRAMIRFGIHTRGASKSTHVWRIDSTITDKHHQEWNSTDFVMGADFTDDLLLKKAHLEEAGAPFVSVIPVPDKGATP